MSKPTDPHREQYERWNPPLLNKAKAMSEEQTAVVWIVEMWTGRRWEPTVGIGLDREEGRKRLRGWQQRNPSDRFRLSQYVARKP